MFLLRGVAHGVSSSPLAVGHTQRECPNLKKEKEVPLQSSDDSESEEDGKVMKNLVAFGAHKEESSESSDSNVGTDDEEYHVLYNKWLNLKDQNLRWENEVSKLREIQQKGLSQFVQGSTSNSGAKEVRQQCNNVKVRQEVLKHGCAAGTRKKTDRCISNYVRPSKNQHRMCCWFCGKVGHKKVECFAREKSKNMAKKVNKTFIKSKRVEEVYLANSGLLDKIKDETSEDGCSSVRSDLEVDHEISCLEPGHEVVCGTKGKEIEVCQEVMRDDLQEGDSEITPRQ
ncbi:hypothetical protein F2Q68_00003489 [Brassica cretica]|uniref:CCHC-type domain-containing protein n=1 Tax=Brassica cretica TaxID=69181 RepID=A0A8S9JDL8_BRACR|nr:hypothetical protein F2Q68_00003489 [Brassica cretica]